MDVASFGVVGLSLSFLSFSSFLAFLQELRADGLELATLPQAYRGELDLASDSGRERVRDQVRAAGLRVLSLGGYNTFTVPREKLPEEVERLVEEKFILPEQGAAVDTAKAAAFGSSPVYKRICAAKKLWREFRFNIEVPANEIYEEAADTDAKILLQGMADLVFEEDGGAVILDYKTDRVSSPEALIERYSGQLNSYARAVQEILGVPVKEKIIYSFQLEREIRV